MKKTLLIMIIAMLTLFCNDPVTPEEEEGNRIVYRTNSGAVQPEYYRENFYTFYPSGEMNHMQTDQQGNVLKDHKYQSGVAFYDSITTFIIQYNIESFSSQYINPAMGGYSMREIQIELDSLSKSITMSGYWEDDLPAALWQLEQKLENKIEALDASGY